MKTEVFDKIVEDCVKSIKDVLASKATEYSTDKDRLHNFKRAARRRDTTPEDALLGMREKHEVSIMDIVDEIGRGNLPSLEIVDEKIGDSINYLIFLKALIIERGEYIKSAIDLAYTFPALEMAGYHRTKYISDTIYVYNIENTNNDFKINRNNQKSDAEYIRTLPPYKMLVI